MALQTIEKVPQGEIRTLYNKVSISGDNNLMAINLNSYGSAETKTDMPFMVRTYTFTPDLTSQDNLIKQAYLYLKGLPEFSGAVDC